MLPNHEGQRVPDTIFRTREQDQWKPVSSKDIFDGRTVVLFALPGAYTPTCSTSHLPRYNELAPVFRQHGVDEGVCLAVNDAFVMDEWARSQEAGNLRLLPDGNGQFTEAMGMLVDKSDLGFGKRSWRYAMLVRDGVIEKMFIEPEKDGDPFEVSDADTMLAYVAPDVRPPQTVTLFTTNPAAPTAPGPRPCWRRTIFPMRRSASARASPRAAWRLSPASGPHRRCLSVAARSAAWKTSRPGWRNRCTDTYFSRAALAGGRGGGDRITAALCPAPVAVLPA